MGHFEEIVRAVEFVERHLQENLTVQDVAQQAGISNWHFQRIFRDYVGETVGAYLRKRRLSEALAELAQSERKVLDIALDYQFGSAEAFSRAFKAEFGRSPLQFRQSGQKIVPFRKARLKRRQLEYLKYELEFAPEIREREASFVVGSALSFVSPLADPHAYMAVIPAHWLEFVRREPEIALRVDKIKVGIIEGVASPRHHIHDDMMDYIAGVPVSGPVEAPTGLVCREIPAGTYAIFRGTGYHEQTQFLVEYVYSTWLPQSEYKRAEGLEFTWLDHRAQALDPATSRVDYYLPVVKK